MRSYLLQEKTIRIIDDSDGEDDTADPAMIEPAQGKKKQKKLNEENLEVNYNRPPISLLCRVRFETQTRKDVEFQSSLIFSNCS